MENNLQLLNERFEIPQHVTIQPGPGGLTTAVVNNRFASAEMTLAGGHVMRYTPHGAPPVLWVSPNASFTIGRAMRGGVPVCWPWFGPHPNEPKNFPLHGFARTSQFDLTGTLALDDGSTEVRMQLSDSPVTHAHWPHSF